MTTPTPPAEPARPTGIRASDAEREAVAARLRDAASAGLLTIAEADERQAAAYAAVTRDELAPLTADLPAEEHPTEELPGPARRGRRAGPLTPAARRWLAVHASIAGFLAAFLVTRWAMDPAPWFWPVWPIFWLGISLLVHRRFASRAAGPAAPPAPV
ncbi:MAG TPA: DUF1707 domain-containing protein [Pseudonocardia sp.]|uniref:DUF1707 SHOCT-like domain-containing protein n=1 Tax=Pseudonocardia sp. TaxID=60912 RepID=UPI002B4B3FEF|nr:DUF1707 domain-containing protein [Pseudonocardia sp.]HLU59387.1 DUF1707 domain-containing protein [Pseudonocardia sp.]